MFNADLQLWIKYLSNGEITVRMISKIVPLPDSKIQAFCHMRNEERTFRLSAIVELKDPTGAIIENIQNFFYPDRKATYKELEYERITPALRCLKYYTARTRGLGSRERQKLEEFVIRNSGQHLDETEIAKYVRGLNYGDDVSCYFDLQSIPIDLVQDCHNTALSVAAGSGRKVIPKNQLIAINAMFVERKRVAFSTTRSEDDDEQKILILEQDADNPIDIYSSRYRKCE